MRQPIGSYKCEPDPDKLQGNTGVLYYKHVCSTIMFVVILLSFLAMHAINRGTIAEIVKKRKLL